jgi:glutamate racemase
MIGFYDSGLGGIGVYIECKKLLPNVSMMYFGDTKHCPLGDKSPQEIYSITQKGVEFLWSKGCNLVIVACNTATALAVRKLQNEYRSDNKKVLGIIRPVSEGLQELTISTDRQIVILATKATIDSGFYTEELNSAGYSSISGVAMPGLADGIEKNLGKNQLKQLILQNFEASGLMFKQDDIFVLACTHYPLVTEDIKSVLREKYYIDDGFIFVQAPFIANKLVLYIQNHPEINLSEDQKDQWFVSGNRDEFEKSVKRLYGLEIVCNKQN